MSARHETRSSAVSITRPGLAYQTHRPDPETPLEETLDALDHLVRQGKVRWIGSSTAPAAQLLEALRTSERLGHAAFVSEQSPYNLLDRRIENEMIPLCLRERIALLPERWGVLRNLNELFLQVLLAYPFSSCNVW